MKRLAFVAAAAALVIFASGATATQSLSAPVGVSGVALDGRVDVAWQPVAGASAYSVYRGTSASSITSQLTPAGGTSGTSFVDSTAANGTAYYYAVRAVAGGAESAASPAVKSTPVARSCSTGNPVVLENCYPGNGGWQLNAPADPSTNGIEGFATATSIPQGGSIDLKINAKAGAPYSIQIYRSGYYTGWGARLYSTVQGLTASAQPDCPSDATTGLVDCANWSVSATITTTSNWPSGVYIARLVRTDTGADSQIVFVVRDDSRHSKLLYGIPFSTYEAYNNWGGKSLYDYNSYGANTVAGSARAVKVSFDRPFAQGNGVSSNDWYPKTDYTMVAWLERSGYDVAYQSATDMEQNGARVRDHTAYVLGVHDEYYSAAMRSALEQARDAGVSLFNTGANAVYWKIRFENGAGGSNRVEVCYKTAGGGPVDPSGTSTSTWRDPAGANKPENALLGVQYIGDNSQAFFPLSVSAAEGGDRVYRYTGLASANGSTTIGQTLVGWEWDTRFANGSEPAGLKVLASSTATGNVIQPNGTYTTASATSNAVKYTAASGALVFSSGTNQWVRGLGVNGDGVGEPDVRIRQATTNILEDMSVVPETPASDIYLDSAPPQAPPTATCPCSLFSDAQTPSSLPYGTYELGVKIQVDQPTTVTALRFYKASGETGTHTGSIWTAGGTRLAQATFASETSSGWQVQSLATPLQLQPGSVYVVSVNANTEFGQTRSGLLSSVQSGPLSTVADGANGVFSTTRGAFPTDSYQSSNYFVDVVAVPGDLPFSVDHTAPAANTTDYVLNGVRATFSGDADASTITSSTFTLRTQGGSLVSASVSYDAASDTATLQPDQPLTNGASYSATLSTGVKSAGGKALAAPFTWSFTVAGCPCSLFPSSLQPVSQPSGTYELGVKVRVNVPTIVNQIRYYKASGEGGSHVGIIWTAAGNKLAQVTFSNESSSGWQTQALGTPVQLQPNTTYVVSVNANGVFAQTRGGLATSVASGPIFTVDDGANGVFSTTPGAFPTDSYQSSNYFVDVVASVGTLPFSVSSKSPAAGSTSFVTGGITATFSRPADASSLTSSTFTLRNSSGALVPASVSYDASTSTATLSPTAALAGGVTYTAQLSTGVHAADGTALSSAVSWSFTTSACPCSLFDSSASPVSQPSGTYELGVKIRVDAPLRVTAIRFYKVSGESGTHTGSVWTASGTRLGQVTFTGESSSGWQQQQLATPVTLQPGSVYVVSVNVNSSFAQTRGGLETAVDSGPLHTIADGANGVFSTTRGAFPTDSYQTSNYYVDVVAAP